MENKKIIIIVSVLLVAFIAGASLLYTKLGNTITPGEQLSQNNFDNLTPATPTPITTADNNDTTASVTPEGSSDIGNTPSGTGNSPDNSSNSREPFIAPDFTVYDRDDKPVRLSDFFGKPIILNFWASWCGPCKSEMPDFEEIYKEYGKDIHFVMVNLTDGAQETMKTATTFLENSGYTFPVYYDKDTDAAYTYQVYGIPVTYFINAEGHLIAQGSSALDAATIKRGIEMILE